MISVDAFKINKADRTHQLTKPTAPKRQPERINSKNQQPERREKSGGSSPFYHLKKSAATTHPNALSIVISVGRVVAVVALLQNSRKGKEDEKIRGNIVRIYKTVIKVKLRVELYLFQTATAHTACNQKPLL